MREPDAARTKPIAFTHAVRSGPVPWLLLAAPVLAFLLGCSNPDYLPNGPGTCVSDRHCSEPTPLCDPTTTTCVQCTAADPSACSGATPICDGTGTCRGCRADPECASQVCQLSGSCLPEDQALYVSPTGVGSDCTASQPCSLQTALSLFTPQRFAIKLSPGTYRGPISIGDNQRLEIHGDGADLTSNEHGPILDARGFAELTILGLRIHHAGGIDVGHGITCNEEGGNMPSIVLYRVRIDTNRALGISGKACRLWVTRSVIYGNYAGGISMTYGTFVIVGNAFFGNGNGSSAVGGVSFRTLQSTTNRLEFNSFARNSAIDPFGGAIDCHVVAFTARNNIMDNNSLSSEQVMGSCLHAYSILRPGTVPSGPGNSGVDPMFENAGAGELHLMAGSPARGAADPASDLTGPAALDIDGDERTSPADIGADEVP